MEKRRFQIALVQMPITADKQKNLAKAAECVAQAKKKTGTSLTLVVLPECFNCPYEPSSFVTNAEEIPNGPSSKAMSAMAKDNKVYLVGGSIPERSGDKVYNSCAVWDPSGNLLTVHRKVHLFDMDIPGICTFKESDVFTPGDKTTVFDLGGICKVGVGICYDLRFSEWAHLYRDQGVEVMIYPGAFDTYTGPLHWSLLLRSRALDNQMFAVGVCGARDETASYVDYGYTQLVDPWGRVLVEADEKETILIQEVDLTLSDQIRKQIPVNKQRRTDLYSIKQQG